MSHLGWDSATAYSHEGFSGMNGKSDAAEMFYQADFQTVYDYATSHGLGRFTFWSVNRDRPCAGGGVASNCSGIDQPMWEFTRITAAYRP
jgi:chitinase